MVNFQYDSVHLGKIMDRGRREPDEKRDIGHTLLLPPIILPKEPAHSSSHIFPINFSTLIYTCNF
jgi:hypothetical protein